MVDISDMIIASLSKVWHLIPIVIAILLFKKFINTKDKKRRININEENEKKGLTLELRTVKKYEKMGYTVIYNEKEQGINLLCSKNNKTLLFQCNNYSKSKSITDKDIKNFISNAIKYVKTNNIKKNDVEFRFVVPYLDVFDKSAIKILKDDSYNCKYVVL
ncbi:MAG: hypothetical protein C0625_08540 [Arcobacter sp.]|nr:MAG: hypothetical protein C0625_08540 [Arcobacter sp.]